MAQLQLVKYSTPSQEEIMSNYASVTLCRYDGNIVIHFLVHIFSG